MKLIFVDEFVDEFLIVDRVCVMSLWKMLKREIFEDFEVLELRESVLGDLEDFLEEDDDEEDKEVDVDVDIDIDVKRNGGEECGLEEGEVLYDDMDVDGEELL